MCNYCCEISFMFILLCFLSEIPCIKKSLSSIECSSFSSNAIYFLFHPLCGQRNEISFRSLFSSLIQRLLLRFRFIFHRSKGYWFVSFLMQKAQMDSLLYDFDSSLFYVERRKRIVFFFIGRKLKYQILMHQLSLFFLIPFWKIEFTLWSKL